jgi:hypothetical protein
MIFTSELYCTRLKKVYSIWSKYIFQNVHVAVPSEHMIYLNHEHYMFTEWNKLYFFQNNIHVLLRKSMLNLKFMQGDSYWTVMKAFVIVFYLCISAQTELVFFLLFSHFTPARFIHNFYHLSSKLQTMK